MNIVMVRQSRIRRLFGRRLARRMAMASGNAANELAKLAEQEAAYEIARQQAKGWKLVTRLETGEGVFVRDDDVVALHIQLPTALYKRLDQECERREITKRQLVTQALEKYLDVRS
jgi:ribosomal protein L5